MRLRLLGGLGGLSGQLGHRWRLPCWLPGKLPDWRCSRLPCLRSYLLGLLAKLARLVLLRLLLLNIGGQRLAKVSMDPSQGFLNDVQLLGAESSLPGTAGGRLLNLAKGRKQA